MDKGLILALTFFMLTVVFSFYVVMKRLDGLVSIISHYFKDFTRCPECDHPAIGASFCEDTFYICPQCGEKFIWKLRLGKYILSVNIEGSEQ